jgi:lysophospholipase L1-like esterase
MEQIVGKLEKTNAKLIWCATTPVPEGEDGRKVGDEIAYNKIAAEIMEKHGIPTDDLHAQALLELPAIGEKKGDVHFTKEGYAHLAKKVSESISASLAP